MGRTDSHGPAISCRPVILQEVPMRRGFTLVGMLVVLVLRGLAAALVAPAVLTTAAQQTPELVELSGATRDAAMRRGRVVYLHGGRASAGWGAGGGRGTLR